MRERNDEEEHSAAAADFASASATTPVLVPLKARKKSNGNCSSSSKRRGSLAEFVVSAFSRRKFSLSGSELRCGGRGQGYDERPLELEKGLSGDLRTYWPFYHFAKEVYDNYKDGMPLYFLRVKQQVLFVPKIHERQRRTQ